MSKGFSGSFLLMIIFCLSKIFVFVGSFDVFDLLCKKN